MECVIVDISRPPTGHVSVFGAYVALSRSRERDMIQILRDFDTALLMHHLSEDLRLEMLRLERLDAETKAAHEGDQ
jgi:hypothetical protein